jgi:hypothetical protein
MTEITKGAKAPTAARGRDDEPISSTPAIHHVGSTLESDPTYIASEQEVESLAADDLTPEARIANIGAARDATMGRGATDLSADVSSTDDAARIRARNGGPEPLKTRLPGDTSSDPHTDLGPDNATSVQHRGE